MLYRVEHSHTHARSYDASLHGVAWRGYILCLPVAGNLHLSLFENVHITWKIVRSCKKCYSKHKYITSCKSAVNDTNTATLWHIYHHLAVSEYICCTLMASVMAALYGNINATNSDGPEYSATEYRSLHIVLAETTNTKTNKPSGRSCGGGHSGGGGGGVWAMSTTFLFSQFESFYIV